MPTPKGQTAMISSTARDLPEHRAMVRDACLRLKIRPIMMEHLAGEDCSAWEVSTGMVKDADVYLGIFAYRYGSSPPNDPARSYTEIQDDKAVELRIPVIPFFIHTEHPVTISQVDKGEKAEKLERLKQRVQEHRIVSYFKSEEELFSQVVLALTKWQAREREFDDDAWTSLYPALLLASPLLDLDRLSRPLQAVPGLHHRWCVLGPEGEKCHPTLAEAVGVHRRLLLSGGAGSGKTVSLKLLLRSAAESAAASPAAPRPVWVPAAAFSAEAPDVAAMVKFVTQQVLQVAHHPTLDEAQVRAAIANGRCLFLVDGLDELPRKLWKERTQAVLDFLRAYGTNPFVIAARPGIVPVQERIPELTMPALGEAAQRKLVATWTERALRAAGRFHRWLERQPAMRALADNPFFLHALVECFLENPDATPGHPAALLLDVLQRRLVAEYSSHVHTGCWRRLSEDGWEDSDVLARCLPVLAMLGAEALQSETATRLPINRALACQHDVPMGAGPRDTFIHSASTLGIYTLTAEELVFPQLLWRDLLAAQELAGRWRTACTAAVPTAAIEAGAQSAWKHACIFLTQLLPVTDLGMCYRAWLAASVPFVAAVVAEGAAVEEGKLRAELRVRFTGEIARVPNDLAGRRLAAQALAAVGDDRLWDDPNHPLVPALAFIAGGTYRVGLSQADRRKLFALQGQVELELADEEFACASDTLPAFAITRFPITHGHFQLFIASGGYGNRAWWDDPGWTWLQAHGGDARQPDHWNDRRYNAENQPVVGISWHEANAYACWLTAMTSDGRTFSLPSVAQWQAATRGVEGRFYPWGDEPAPARCNCWHEEDLGMPSPVGIYPEDATPEGVHDLAGNVAEWAIAPDGVAPVHCGGSWFASIHACRATRYRAASAEMRTTEVGFRLVTPLTWCPAP